MNEWHAMNEEAHTRNVTSAEVRAAAGRLAGKAVHTPVITALELSERFGVACGIKAESFQRTGSFKFRGAYNFIATLDPGDRARGVVAPSSGNHGQAVACVAAMFGVPATIVMPTTVTPFKRAGVERYGAASLLAGTTSDDRYARAMEVVRETGAVMVPPYDHPAIIAGQATCGLEMVEARPEARTFLVPVGGGGLSAGIATIIKAERPGSRVIVVEPAGAAKLSAAWAAGAPVQLDGTASVADGLLATRIGSRNFEHLRQFADEVVTVTEDEIAAAVSYLFRELKLVAEASGATTMAALLAGKVVPEGETIAVLSGGNISVDALRSLCMIS